MFPGWLILFVKIIIIIICTVYIAYLQQGLCNVSIHACCSVLETAMTIRQTQSQLTFAMVYLLSNYTIKIIISSSAYYTTHACIEILYAPRGCSKYCQFVPVYINFYSIIDKSYHRFSALPLCDGMGHVTFQLSTTPIIILATQCVMRFWDYIQEKDNYLLIT